MPQIPRNPENHVCVPANHRKTRMIPAFHNRMSLPHSLLLIAFFICYSSPSIAQSSDWNSEDYLKWSFAQAEKIGKSTREGGKAGSYFDTRIISTDHAINYRLRATLMTPEVIRATARIIQLTNRLTDDETRKLVAEADAAGDFVVMVEIDPNEGSGVVPLDWRVFLQPKGAKTVANSAIKGIKMPNLRSVKALAGINRRDYDYDVFWIAFPLVDVSKTPNLPLDLREIQLIVGIYGKEGQISWPMPQSVLTRMKELSAK